MEIKNAIIESVTISIEDGFLDVKLILNYGGACQAFGGWVLYAPKDWTHHKVKSFAGHFIYRVMEVAGVTRWESLAGKTIRALSDYSHVEQIGHIVNDDWFNPRKDFNL
jgi:hypothetical protein